MSAHDDLLDMDIVYSDTDLVAWYPRAAFTRTQARHHFWRSTNDATWDVTWTRIRVVARYVCLDPSFHPSEGRYVQCGPDTVGATAVWRCETVGRDGKPMLPELCMAGTVPR